MLDLDLNDLTVQSFPTVDGDPTQWLMRAPPPTYDTTPACCRDDLAVAAMTVERICTTTR